MLKNMSKADPEVAEYPFTTRMPLPGMARWENIQTQLIDMPPIMPENAQSWMWAMLRMADGLLLVFDIGDDDVLEHAESLIAFMEENNVRIKNDGEREFTEKRAMCAANKFDLPGAQSVSYTHLDVYKRQALSILSVIDNPRQDIPLAAVLRSPIEMCIRDSSSTPR